MAQRETYYQAMTNKNIEQLEAVLSKLPYFCKEFSIGIDATTAASTKLAYARDLTVFFDFLTKNVPYFRQKSPIDMEIADLEQVKIEHIEHYLSYLKLYTFGAKRKSNDEKSRARKLSAVRSLFKYFYNKNKISQNILTKIASPKLHEKPIVRLEGDEIENILLCTEQEKKFATKHQNVYNLNTRERDLTILTLFLGTGIRISELVGINIGDIDIASNRFVVTRKGGNRTYLYFSDEVAEVLSIYVVWREQRLKAAGIKDEQALFISLQNKRITTRAVQNLVKKLSSLVTNVKNITPHKLRSTFGTELYKATKDIYVVAETLGHKDVNTTKRHYAASSDEIKRSASEKIRLRKPEEQ